MKRPSLRRVKSFRTMSVPLSAPRPRGGGAMLIVAVDCPMLVVVDEATGEKYARMTAQKGLGPNQEMAWLVRDLSEELKTWGHTGGSD